MTSPSVPSKAIIAPLPTHLLALVDDLHRSGAITDAERADFVAVVQREVDRDEATAASRNAEVHPLQPVVPTTQETTMKPKTMINHIERTSAVMEAQIEKLNAFAPKPISTPLVSGGIEGSVSAMLDKAVCDQLQGAADVLHAIAEAEVQVRLVEDDQDAPANGRRQPLTIDGEAVVIHPEDAK